MKIWGWLGLNKFSLTNTNPLINLRKTMFEASLQTRVCVYLKHHYKRVCVCMRGKPISN